MTTFARLTITGPLTSRCARFRTGPGVVDSWRRFPRWRILSLPAATTRTLHVLFHWYVDLPWNCSQCNLSRWTFSHSRSPPDAPTTPPLFLIRPPSLRLSPTRVLPLSGPLVLQPAWPRSLRRSTLGYGITIKRYPAGKAVAPRHSYVDPRLDPTC